MISSIHTTIGRLDKDVFQRVLQIIVTLLFIIQTQYNVYIVTGYPSGAGTCIGNKPAVTDTPHLNPLLHTKINGGTLTDAGIIVQITNNDVSDEIQLVSNRELKQTNSNTSSIMTNIRELYTNTNYTISVIGTMYAYKGYLLRVQGLETQSSSSIKNSLQKGKNTKEISDTTCTNYSKVSALTHITNDFKQQHTGTLYLNETGLIQLDITIVGVNNNTISLYAYDNFTINFITKPPIAVPVPVVTKPVTKPINVPFAQMKTPDPVSAPAQPQQPITIDEQYVKTISNDTVNNIIVQYYNITPGISTTGTTLSLDDLIIVQATINLWFTQFYNNFSSTTSQNPLTTNGFNTSDITATAITKLGDTNRKQRQLQRQLQNGSSTGSLLQDFIVSGSMISYITNVRQQAAGTIDNTSIYNNTLTLTYNQILSYKVYEPTYPNLSKSMTGPENYKILSSSEYILLPFANSTANTELVRMLQKKLPLIFNSIIQPITIPTIRIVDNGGGDVVPPPTVKNIPNNKKSSAFLIAGIIVGVIGLLVIAVYLYCCMCKNKNTDGKRGRGGDDDDNSNSEDNSSGDNENSENDDSNNKKKDKTVTSGTKPETISRLSIARMFGPTGGGAAPSTSNPPESLLDVSVFDNDSQYTSSSNAHTSTAAAAAAAATAAYNKNKNNNDSSNSSDDNNNTNTTTTTTRGVATLGISPNTFTGNNNNTISNSDPSSLFAKKQTSQPPQSLSQSQNSNNSNKNNIGYVSSPSSTPMQSPLIPVGGHVINGKTTSTDATVGTTTTTREQNNSIGFNNDNNYNDDSDNGGEWSVGAQTNIGSLTGVGVAGDSHNNNNTTTKQSSNWRNGNDTAKLMANGLMPPSTGGGNNNGTASNNNNNNNTTTKSNEYVVYAPSGKLGIVVDNPDDDSGPIIYAIKETSPLLDSQLNVGDRLIMVDEINVTKMAPALISKLISKRANNPMRKLTLLQTSNNYDDNDNDVQDERMT